MKLCYLMPYWNGNFELIYNDGSEIPANLLPYVDEVEVLEAFIDIEKATLIVRLDI